MNRREEFSKNVLIVSLGPLISVIVSLISEPIIARFWEPYKFGVMSYYNSIVLMLAPLVFLRYDYSVIQANNEVERHSLLVLSFIILSVSLVFLYLLYPFIVPIFQSDFPWIQYKGLFFLTLLAASIYMFFRFWSTSYKRFKIIATSFMVLQISNTMLLIVYGYFGATSENNAIVIRSLSFLLSPVFMIISYLKHDFIHTIRLVSIKSIFKSAKKHLRYPLYDVAGIFFSTTAFYLPMVLITKFWGQVTNGLFSKAFMLIYVLVLFLSESINRVFHKEIADRINNKEDITSVIGKVISTIVQITVLPLTIIILSGPEIFSIFLGYNWIESGYFARYISIWLFLILIITSLSPLYGLLNKQFEYAAFSLLILIVRISILIIFGVNKYSANMAIVVLSCSSFFLISLQLYSLISQIGVSVRPLVKILTNKVVTIFPLVLSFIMIKSFLHLQGMQLLILLSVLSLPNIYFYYFSDLSVLKTFKFMFHTITPPKK